MKRQLLLILTIVLLCTIIINSAILASAAENTADKLDYVGLLTRMEKFQINLDTNDGWWNHRVLMTLYPKVIEPISFPPTVSNPCSDYLSDDEYKLISGIFNAQGAETGFPFAYYYVRGQKITRADFEKSLSVKSGGGYASTIAEAVYSEDARVILETLMSPEIIVNPLAYASDDVAKRYEADFEQLYGYNLFVYNFEDVFIRPIDLIRIPLETLETWNYSDEYWYDYYSFIDYLNEVDNSEKYSSTVIVSASMRNLPEEKAELDRRVELYANRVANAETGDDSAVRAVFLATAAVVCAVIPATVAIATKRRRRED